MDTLYEYIRWRGDERFSYRSFNDVDALIICYLAYLDMSHGIKTDKGVGSKRSADIAEDIARERMKPIKLREICKRIKARDGGYNILSVSGGFGESPIIDAAAASKRFGDLYISDYVEIFDTDEATQFSAMTVDLDNHTSFIAYRGTDDSLPGWKEDFMLAYRMIPGQKLAYDYARRHIEADKDSGSGIGRRYYIGGHSKGGNLALYVASLLPDELWQRVEHVYILDGPGLCKEVLPGIDMSHIADRTTNIRPEFSVIGSLFDTDISDTRIVKSNAPGMMQHDLSRWGIEYGELSCSDRYDPAAEWLNAGIDRWIENADMMTRKRFVTDLFDAFAAGGYMHLKDLNNIDKKGIQSIITKMSNMSPEAKSMAHDLPKSLLRTLRRK